MNQLCTVLNMKQEDVWRGIDYLADEIGVTPSRLARMAGLDQAVFSSARRRKADGSLRWPSMDSLAKVLRVADISIGDFVNYMHASPSARAGFKLPCIAFSEAGAPDRYDEDGFPQGPAWDRVEFPDLQDPRCFGLTIDSDGYEPVYRSGDLIVCAPGLSVHRGDRIVFRRSGALSGLFIGVLVRQTPFRIDIGALDGSTSETLPAADVGWIARIAWARQ